MLKSITVTEEGRSNFRTTPFQGMYYSDTLNNWLYVKEHLQYIRLDEDTHAYGVCDSVSNLLENYDFESDHRNLVVFLTEIRREDQPEDGGWRWSKWGIYCGNQNVFADYLYDEPEIESVYVWECWQVGEIENIEEEHVSR